MLGVAVGGEAALHDVETRFARGDEIKHGGARDGARHLSNHVREHAPRRKTASRPEPDRHGRVQVASGDVANGISHRENRQTERERDPEKADADGRKGCGQDGAPAPSEDEPRSTQKLSGKWFGHVPSENQFPFIGRSEICPWRKAKVYIPRPMAVPRIESAPIRAARPILTVAPLRTHRARRSGGCGNPSWPSDRPARKSTTLQAGSTSASRP